MLTLPTLVLLAFTSLVATTGIPHDVHAGPASQKQQVDCHNITTGVNTTCYTALNLTNYFTTWNTTYRRETCSPSQLWSTCFLNTAYAAAYPSITYTAANISSAHNCASINATVAVKSCTEPVPDPMRWDPEQFYSVLTIYNLQRHVMNWGIAINARGSRLGIEHVLSTVRGRLSPDGALKVVINEYGGNQEADAKLVQLMQSAPSVKPVPAGGVSGTGPVGVGVRVGAGAVVSGTPTSAKELVPIMVARLAEVLLFVMKDFDGFRGVVRSGAYSGDDLNSHEVLASRLRNGIETELLKGVGKE